MTNTAAIGARYLEHHGVKGQKWGVIRDRIKGGHQAFKNLSTSQDAQKANQVRSKAKLTGVSSLSNKELQDVITRMNLETQYHNLRRVQHDQSLLGMGQKWVGNFVTDLLKDVAASWLKRPGTNATGRTSSRVRAWTTGQEVGRILDGEVVPRAITP